MYEQQIRQSVRAVLRPDPAKLHAAKEALKQVFNLLEELADPPFCECPKCAPEKWVGSEQRLSLYGFTKHEYPCEFS